MNQQQFPRTTIHKERSFDDWRGVIVVVAIFIFVYFTGPLVFLALLLQWWAALSVWRAPDRWASLRTFAWLSLLLYLPTWLFWPQIGLFWHAHLPGDFLIWPPTLGAIFVRSWLSLPLAPALALLLERQNPGTLTIRHIVRRPRPGEVIGPTQQATGQQQEAEPQKLSTAKDGQAQKPAGTTGRKKQPGAGATKSPTGNPPARKRTARDPRPVGIVWAEQAEAERRTSAAQPPATPPPAQPEQQATRKAMVPEEEEQAAESTVPDPFKAKIDWSRVKE